MCLGSYSSVDMEESICLDDEGLLSPATEQPPSESPLAQLDRPTPPEVGFYVVLRTFT